jgi:dUTP pyrophosphatase
VHPLATLPQYQTKGAAAFDLHAIIEEKDESPPGSGITIPVGQARTFRTGFAYEIPDGWVMKIHSRSGHGFKHGIVLANGTGIIDSDYRGELLVRLRNEGDFPFTVHHGHRVAQAMVEQAMQWELVEIGEDEELSSTDRGENGCGSTGR